MDTENWIDVRDRLPEPDWPEKQVLMCSRIGNVYEGYHLEGDDWRFPNHAEAYNIIAWRRKPEPITLAELDKIRTSHG